MIRLLASAAFEDSMTLRGLSLLGILPNQIRQLLKSSGHPADLAFEEISMELFWGGYKIWCQRKRRNDYFWKHIAPEEWTKQFKGFGQTKRKKTEQKNLSDRCRNPFHFLDKDKILSNIMPTPCLCYNRTVSNNSRFVDISSFFSIPDHINLPSLQDSVLCSDYTTREDNVRGAHDRSKIFTRLK